MFVQKRDPGDLNLWLRFAVSLKTALEESLQSLSRDSHKIDLCGQKARKLAGSGDNFTHFLKTLHPTHRSVQVTKSQSTSTVGFLLAPH